MGPKGLSTGVSCSPTVTGPSFGIRTRSRSMWYFVWFDLPSHHARQDDGFAGHVEPREVVPRVGLGVVEINRLPYRFGEGPAALDRAHDEAQSAARARSRARLPAARRQGR